MSLDLETAMAYVEGELPPQRRSEVEAAMAVDPEWAARIDAMHAAHLPYQTAFAQHAPVPDALWAHVAQLSAVASASHDMALAGGGSHFAQWGGKAQKLAPMALLLLAGLVLGYIASARLSASSGTGVEPWVKKVASYHSMYSRETVADGGTNTVQTEALLQRLSRMHGLALAVPDLRKQGLQFVRAQQLQFEGQMVVQLVYLPEQGLPIALCLTQDAPRPQQVLNLEGLQALTWQDKGWGYVLIGDLPLERMQSIKGNVLRAMI